MTRDPALQFLHTSDTHLGCAQFDSRDREQDVYEAFSEVVDTAVKDKVDAVLHAGDIFHVPRPGGTPLVKLADGIKNLGDKGIKFYFTLGEHDISRVTGTPSPYVFHKLGLATYVGGEKPVLHGDTMILGFPKARRSEIDGLVSSLKQADEAASRHAGKKVLVLHQGLSEFNRWAGEMTANDLPPNFDYYAMGHLHDHGLKRFDRLHGPVCYPGSIDPTPGEGVKETKKGFYIVDMSGAEASEDWVEIKSSRQQYAFDVDYWSIRERAASIADEVRSKGHVKKPVLFLKVRGEGIENSKVTSAFSDLIALSLHCGWEAVEERPSADKLFAERPSDVRQEIFDLAARALGDQAVAAFAVKELLPLLEAGEHEEALDLVYSTFEASRFKGDAP